MTAKEILCICGKSKNYLTSSEKFYGKCPACNKDLTKKVNRI